ncbi:putative transmembrane 1 protein, partial [Operophtera brumata]
MFKAKLQCDEKSTVAFQNGSSECEQNVALSFTPKKITCTESDERSLEKQYAGGKVSQGAENKEIRRSNTSNNLTEKFTETQYHPKRRSSSCSSVRNKKSFALPEGLAMDPLAPTALAVSSAEFMDRMGSGLTLLREHGKKVQKFVWKNRKFDILKKSWKSIVNVVLIEAKDLPDGPTGNLYCKF